MESGLCMHCEVGDRPVARGRRPPGTADGALTPLRRRVQLGATAAPVLHHASRFRYTYMVHDPASSARARGSTATPAHDVPPHQPANYGRRSLPNGPPRARF